MKTGDYVYYFRKIDGDRHTVPAIVLKLSKTRIKLLADFIEGSRYVWVSPENCQLQSEWLKENS